MSGLIISPDDYANTESPRENEESVKPDEMKINYKPTEDDEQNFFLMYHLKFQPSEVENMDPEYRKWIIARFMAQKHMEQEMMARHQIMNEIGPNIQGNQFPNLHIRK